jgi:hypothetical protein
VRFEIGYVRILGAFVAMTLGAVSLAALGGCGDETSPHGEAERRSATDAAAHKTDWLAISSPLSPAQWLVSRGKDAPAALDDPEVQRVTQQLVAAHKRYRESERMIANRSAQVSEMLRNIGVTEGAVQVLDDLTGIGADVGQTEGYGAISQYYFNLRAASASRADAIATLKARYGAKS